MAAIDYALAFPRQDLGLTLELHIAADEHERERHEVARRLMAKAVALAGRISDDDTYDGGPVLVVCAVCSDSLAWVMSQLPLGGKLAVVAVSVGDDGDVWELGLSAVPLPGGRALGAGGPGLPRKRRRPRASALVGSSGSPDGPGDVTSAVAAST